MGYAKLIADARDEYIRVKLDLRGAEEEFEDLNYLLKAETDYKALGSNNEIREAKFQNALRQNEEWLSLRRLVNGYRDKLEILKAEMEKNHDAFTEYRHEIYARTAEELHRRSEHSARAFTGAQEIAAREAGNDLF